MDLVLLFIGILLVIRKKWSSTLTVIAVLGSTYLQIPIADPLFVNFLFPHEVKDAAIILEFILIYAFIKDRGYTYKSIPLKQINIFFVFLLFSGLYDISCDVSFGDVVRQWRHWFLLLIVFIAPLFSQEEIEKSYKQLFYISAISSVYLLITRFTDINLIELNIYETERGIKPSSFSMMFAFLCIVNPWDFKLPKRIFYICLFTVPIILNIKMTYIVTIVLMIGVYVLIVSNLSIIKKLFFVSCLSIFATTMLVMNDKMTERVREMTTNIHSLDENNMHADNFSFRILHARERLIYITQDPIRILRGIGFIAEKNITHDMFYIGLYDKELKKIRQIDTGDIAWSLFLCRLGIGGLCVFLLLYFKLLSVFWKNRKDDTISAYMVSVMIVFLFFTSFGNTLIAMDDFYLYPILFANAGNLIEEI